MAGAWIDKRRLASVDLIMKQLLALLFLLPLVAIGQTQGTSVRALNGTTTNLSHGGYETNLSGAFGLKLAASVLGTVYSWIDTNNTARVSVVGDSTILKPASGADIITVRGAGTSIAGTTTNLGDMIIGGVATGNGLGLTNVLEKNIAVGTNTWGNAVVNFSLGTMVATNMAADLTITGITAFNPTNLNWQTVFLTPNAAVRAVAVPADWWVSGFTNATTVSIPSSNTAILSVRCQVGIFTNASIELFQ